MSDTQKKHLVNQRLIAQEQELDEYVKWQMIVWSIGGFLVCLVFYISFGIDLYLNSTSRHLQDDDKEGPSSKRIQRPQ
jgi:hypothetical protein